jgi:hypothetical protein
MCRVTLLGKSYVVPNSARRAECLIKVLLSEFKIYCASNKVKWTNSTWH